MLRNPRSTEHTFLVDLRQQGGPLLEQLKKNRDAGESAEGVLLALEDVTQRMISILLGETAPKSIIASGGGARNRELLQRKADRIGADYILTREVEQAAYGAAITAAAGLNWFNSLRSATASWVKIREVVKPKQQ